MSTILYSGFGTTDPVRGMRDGGLMHILRHYRPDTVYLFLTKEIIQRDREDQRIEKTFEYIRENWGGYCPELIRYETDIEDPSDMDILLDPMNKLLDQILKEHPKTELLINLSSGTPQMQIILAQMALDPRYPTRGIQVKNPERQSGTAERNNSKFFPVDEALGLNEDEESNQPNRCCEPKMTAIRREAVRNQLNSLLDQRNYAAIAQMGSDLPAPIPKLARHLDYRSQFLLNEAEKEAIGLSGMGLQAGKGVYPYPIYEMIEYFTALKNLVHIKRYNEFVLRLNPFLVRLQLELLEHHLEAQGLKERDIIRIDGKRKRISPALLRNNIPALLTYLENDIGATLEERDVSIWILNKILTYFQEDSNTLKLLDACEKVNSELRNSTAHDLSPVTNDRIRQVCGSDAEGLIRGLEELLIWAVSSYGDQHLKKRLRVYDHCDRIIRECL